MRYHKRWAISASYWDSGFALKRALGLNIASASFTIPGAVAAYFAFSAIEWAPGVVLALAASSFLYIALADLFLRLRQERGLRALPAQLGLIILGVVIIMAVHRLTT